VPKIVYMEQDRKVAFALDASRAVYTIGRSPSCDIRVSSPGLSRRHAELRSNPTTGAYECRDLGSANGTYVNGNKISTHTLADGDEVLCGEFRFRYEAGAPGRRITGALSIDPSALPKVPDLGAGRGSLSMGLKGRTKPARAGSTTDDVIDDVDIVELDTELDEIEPVEPERRAAQRPTVVLPEGRVVGPVPSGPPIQAPHHLLNSEQESELDGELQSSTTTVAPSPLEGSIAPSPASGSPSASPAAGSRSPSPFSGVQSPRSGTGPSAAVAGGSDLVRRERDQLQEQVRNLVDEVRQLRAELEAAPKPQDLERAERAVTDHEAATQRLESRVASLVARLGEMESAAEKKDAALATAQEALAARTQELAASASEVERAKAKLEDALGVTSDLQRRVAERDADIARLEQELGASQEALAGADERAAELDGALQALQREAEDHTLVVGDLTAALGEKTNAIARLEGLVAERDKRINNLERDVAEIRALAEARQTELNTARADGASLRAERESLRAEIDQIRSGAAAEQSGKHAEIVRLRASLEAAEQQRIDAVARAADLEAQFASNVAETRSEAESHRREREIMSRQLVDVEARLREATEGVERARGERNERLKEMESELAKARSEAARAAALRTENDRLARECRGLREMIEEENTAANDVTRLRKQREEMSAAFKDLSDELRQLIAVNEELQAQLRAKDAPPRADGRP